MNVEIRDGTAQFPEKEYINGIAVAVWFCNCSTLNFLIYMRKIWFSFIQCILPPYFFTSAPQLEIESTRVTSDNGSTGEWSIYRAAGGALVCIRLPGRLSHYSNWIIRTFLAWSLTCSWLESLTFPECTQVADLGLIKCARCLQDSDYWSRIHERTIFVEVSGHNLESSQTPGFYIKCLHYKPVSNFFQPTFAQGWGK